MWLAGMINVPPSAHVFTEINSRLTSLCIESPAEINFTPRLQKQHQDWKDSLDSDDHYGVVQPRKPFLSSANATKETTPASSLIGTWSRHFQPRFSR
jgi:hypothetical protein